MRLTRTAMAFAAPILIVGSTWAQPASSPSAKPATVQGVKADGADGKFVREAALGGMTEVELGKLADKNGAAADVKAFGKHMVEDHGKANDELAAIAKSKGMNPPTSLDAQHKMVVDKLSAMSGAAFDKAFMTQMVLDHKKTVALFEKESSGGKDSDIKGFAGKTLPTIKEHLKMAQGTQKAASKS